VTRPALRARDHTPPCPFDRSPISVAPTQLASGSLFHLPNRGRPRRLNMRRHRPSSSKRLVHAISIWFTPKTSRLCKPPPSQP